jgi:hypothetical protein
MNDEMDYTVTLTAKDLAFRERARAAGIPAMVVSMYAGALQRLVEDEREECAKVCVESEIRFEELCDKFAYSYDQGSADASRELAAAIRARGEK